MKCMRYVCDAEATEFYETPLHQLQYEDGTWHKGAWFCAECYDFFTKPRNLFDFTNARAEEVTGSKIKNGEWYIYISYGRARNMAEQTAKQKFLNSNRRTLADLQMLMEQVIEGLGKYKNYKRKVTAKEQRHFDYLQSLYNCAEIQQKVLLERMAAARENRYAIEMDQLLGAIHAVKEGADITKLRKPRRRKRGK